MAGWVIVTPEMIELERWSDAGRGDVTWKTLISCDRTDSCDLVSGIADFGPRKSLAVHHHIEPELVHVVRGRGKALIDGSEHVLAAGSTLFVASDVRHGFVAGDRGLELYYTFAVSSFEDIEYHFA